MIEFAPHPENAFLLPKSHDYIYNEHGPRMLEVFKSIYGIKEAAGEKNNPIIIGWAKEVGLPQYNKDSIAWCGLCAAIMATRGGKAIPKNPLWARNWTKFGVSVKVAKLGYILVFSRADGFGHVGIYLGEDLTHYHVGGGNQEDAVSIMRIEKSRCIGIQQPIYTTGIEPANVRQIFVSPKGILTSSNEA